MVWDAIIAGYLFLAGTGAGAFALAVIASWVNPDVKVMRRVGLFTALIAVGVGCLLLMVDARAGLANPLRFFYLIANLQSVMAWGVIILVCFMAVVFVELVLNLIGKKTPRALDAIGLVLSLGVAIYTGVLLGDAPGFPLWNIAVLPILFVVSAASTGFAAVVAITYLLKSDEPTTLNFLPSAEKVLPVVELALIVVLLIVTSSVSGSAGAAAAASVFNLTGGPYAIAFWGGLVIVGLVVPCAIEVSRTIGSKASSEGALEATKSKTLPLVACLCVLVGGFMLRYLIVMAAVPVVVY